MGGETASNLDARESGARDLRVIVPSVLRRHHARAGAAAAVARRPAAARRHRGAQRRRDGRRGRAAVRRRLRLPRQRPGDPADRVRVPGRAGDRLQHLPDDPGPRGVGAARHPGRRPAGAGGDRRGHHVAPGMVLAATFGALVGAAAAVPRADGVPGRLRRPARHLRRPVAGRAGRRRDHRRPGLVAEPAGEGAGRSASRRAGARARRGSDVAVTAPAHRRHPAAPARPRPRRTRRRRPPAAPACSPGRRRAA